MQAAAIPFAKRQSEFTARSAAVLFASIVGMAIGPSGLLLTSFTLFIEPMSREFAWNRADASLPATVIAASLALSSPAKGYLVDRFGARGLILIATPLLGALTALLAFVPGVDWRIYALFLGIGLSSPGNVPYGQLIGSWFQRTRGMAYGLLGFGFALCIPIGLQLTRPLVDGYGWRKAFVVFGSIQWLALPVLYVLLRGAKKQRINSPEHDEGSHSGLTLTQAWRTRAFWLVVGNLICSVFVISAVAVHGVPLLSAKGLSRAAATDVVSLLWIGATVSQPLLGYLMDKLQTPRVALPFALVALAGLGLLVMGSRPIVCGIAMFLLGVGSGGESGTTQYFVSRYCGLRHFSVIYGSIQPFTYLLAGVAGAWIVGLLYDATGSYRLDQAIMLVSLAVAAVLLILMPQYRFAVKEPTNPQPATERAADIDRASV